MKWIGKIVVALATFSALPAAAAAQESAPAAASPVTLAGDVRAVKTITGADGVERVELVEPEVIVPGDQLVFGTDYANTGSETVSGFVVTNPVPAAVRLAPDADPDLVVSVDGGKSWGTLAGLTTLGEDGTARPATHAEVTHVRWTIESIAPGETGRLEYPAIIR